MILRSSLLNLAKIILDKIYWNGKNSVPGQTHFNWPHIIVKQFLWVPYNMDRDISVGIEIGYGLDGPRNEPRWDGNFRIRPDWPCVPPRLLYNGYRLSFPGVKWPGRGVEHSPPSSVEVKERMELYATPPLGLHGLLWGQIYLNFTV